MINLFKTELAYKFITLPRDKFLEYIAGHCKRHYKTESLIETYGHALLDLGYGALFAIDEPVKLAQIYIATIINHGSALSAKEYEFVQAFNEETKSLLTLPPKTMVEDYRIAEHNLTEDSHLKVVCAAKYIAKTFCNMTKWYSKFANGEVNGEELTEHLRGYIQQSYNIVVDDTNVAYNIPISLSKKNRIKVYIPSSVDLTSTSPTEYMLSEVITVLNDNTNYGLPSKMYDSVIKVLINQGNLYKFYADSESCFTIFKVDIYARRYMAQTIEDILNPTFKLGKPFEVEATKTKTIAYGNYDGTLTLFVGNHIVNIDKTLYGATKRLLQNYKVCSIRKSLGIVREDDKSLLWDCLYTNAKPIDNDYNNIVKKNVQ